MKKLCDEDEDEDEKKRKRRATGEEENEEKEKKRFVPGVRGGGGPLAVPASSEAHDRRREEIRRNTEREENVKKSESGKTGSRYRKENLEDKFRKMGLDFESEWKSALKENLVLMRNDEVDKKRVERLLNRMPRGGLRHNNTVVG